MYIPWSIHISTNHNSSLINNQWVTIHEHQVSSKQNHSNNSTSYRTPACYCRLFPIEALLPGLKRQKHIMSEETQTSWSLPPEEGRQIGNTWELGKLAFSLIFTFGESWTSVFSSNTAASLIFFFQSVSQENPVGKWTLAISNCWVFSALLE